MKTWNQIMLWYTAVNSLCTRCPTVWGPSKADALQERLLYLAPQREPMYALPTSRPSTRARRSLRQWQMGYMTADRSANVRANNIITMYNIIIIYCYVIILL